MISELKETILQTEISIIGGLYREVCRFPKHDIVLGSGGRAALALAEYINTINLNSYITTGSTENSLRSMPSNINIKNHGFNCNQLISFDYLHSLCEPRIFPSRDHTVKQKPIEIESDCVLQFGMLEGSAKIKANRCVYDPQNSKLSKPFDEFGSKCDELVVIGNKLEVCLLGKDDDYCRAAKTLLKSGAKAVVVKNGVHGAKIFTDNQQIQIDAYQADTVFKIGTGDVFSAVFCAAWAIHNHSFEQAGKIASKAVCQYVNDKILPIKNIDYLLQKELKIAKFKSKKIYIAAPFFNIQEMWLVEHLVYLANQFNMEHIFSPFHAFGVCDPSQFVIEDINAINECDALIAIVDSFDTGTLFEIGYAKALNKEVYILSQKLNDDELVMMKFTGCHIFNDIASLMYNLCWEK